MIGSSLLGRRSTNWPRSGGPSTRRSCGCGTTRGRSSSRSWTTTWRSARWSAQRTRSSAQRPLPPRDQSPCALPHRAGSVEVSVSGYQILDPTGRGRARWTMRWKPALKALAITFADRWPAAENY